MMYRRVLQFRAGPNETSFDMCEEHKEGLTDPKQMPDLFFADEKDKVEEIDDDTLTCYCCEEPPFD